MENRQLLFFLIALFLLLPNSAFLFSAGLEINYPTLSSGSHIDALTNLPEYMRYVFDFAMFVGFFSVFLSLVWAGVLWIMSPAKASFLAEAKDRIMGAFSGLLLLVLLYLIVVTINPQLAFFNRTGINQDEIGRDDSRAPGVYFFVGRGCPFRAENPYVKMTSIPDFGEINNRINSVYIQQKNISFISVLFDSENFYGRCQYIDPNRGCSNVAPFAGSASIYNFNYGYSGLGVIFYRKAFFDDEGGYYMVKDNQIKGKILILDLRTMDYRDPRSGECTVPEKERDCTSWDNQGNCLTRKCPSVYRNLTSIELKGNYFVLLVYYDEKNDTPAGPWSFCQAFPTKDDVNRDGPVQIKWENVNNVGMTPNFALIIPVTQK